MAAERRERRQELRVPVDLPVTLTRVDGAERVRAQAGDLSRYGIRAWGAAAAEAPEWAQGTAVAVTLEAPGAPQETEASVRWTRAGAGRWEAGLRFAEPVEVLLPLPDVAAACRRFERSTAATREQLGILREAEREFFPITLAGMLLRSVSDLIHARHTFASGVCSLASFRLKRAADWAGAAGDAAGLDWHGLLRSADDLDRVVTVLKSLSGVYRVVKDKFSPQPETALALVDVNAVLARVVKDFSWIAAQLEGNGPLAIRYDSQPPALICASPRDIALGLEAILLQAYLSTRFDGGTGLDITSATGGGCIRVLFKNDASRLLDSPCVQIRPGEKALGSGLALRDRRILLWLHAALLRLQPIQAELSIKSESGLNEMALLISQDPDRNGAVSA